MAVPWSDSQRPRVVRILRDCPVASNRCDSAARRLLPIAREVDDQAQIWKLVPSVGKYVLAKHPDAREWRFHATVEANAHYVDALTGVDGAPVADYLRNYWDEIDAIELVQVQPDEIDP